MRSSLPRLLAVLIAGLSIHSAAMASSNVHKAKAKLFGPTPLKGQARYEQKPKQGQTFKRFVVEVENGLPAQTLGVAVNGVTVGALTTNSNGRGELELRTEAFIDSPGDGSPIPANFPKLDTGDIVSVGPLVGVVFDKKDDSTQNFKLSSGLAGAGGVSGHVKYQERMKNGGLRRIFKVEVEDAAPGQNFDIFVKNVFVGTLVMSNGAETKFELRTAAFIDDPDDGQPMPSSFPSLQPGDQVQVGSMTTTLQQVGGGNGNGNDGGGNGGGGGDDNGGDDNGGNGGGGNDDPPGHD